MLCDLVKRFGDLSQPDLTLTLDHGILAQVVTTIGPSEEVIHSHMPYWLTFFKFIVKRLDLLQESGDMSEECKEERRRFEPSH